MLFFRLVGSFLAGVWFLCSHAAASPHFVANKEIQEVDMLLCLAADVSESVAENEYHLQRIGHSRAIQDPQVVRTIESGRQGRIAVIYVEWAKQDQQYLNVDWHLVSDPASAKIVADKIQQSPPPPWINFTVRNTSTGEAIRYCMKQFDKAPFTAAKRVIDLSSDGTNNVGASINSVRDEAVKQGVVINALAITESRSPFPNTSHTRPKGGLVRYFENNVVGGAGAFVQQAKGYESFGEMIKRKFLQELASAN